jgi:hypothetical protein
VKARDKLKMGQVTLHTGSIFHELIITILLRSAVAVHECTLLSQRPLLVL